MMRFETVWRRLCQVMAASGSQAIAPRRQDSRARAALPDSR